MAAEGKGVRLISDLKGQSRIYGDSILLGEVIGNLVSNAIKFTENGDTITIHYEVNQENALITVTDTGTGIHEALIPKLFLIEVKTSKIGTHGETGTGFGLPYSHDLIHAHGGEIEVVSTLGAGSSFQIHLPLPRPLLLLQCENSTTSKLITASSQRLGFELITSASIDETRTLLANHEFNLLMLGDELFGESLAHTRELFQEGHKVLTLLFTEAEEEASLPYELGAIDFISHTPIAAEIDIRIRRFIG